MGIKSYIATKVGAVTVGDVVWSSVPAEDIEMGTRVKGTVTNIDEVFGVITIQYFNQRGAIKSIDAFPSDITSILDRNVDEVDEEAEVDMCDGCTLCDEETALPPAQPTIRDWKCPEVGECKFASLYDGCDEEVCRTNTAQKSKRLFISSMV